MTNDARGHKIPAAGDHPQRQTLLDLVRLIRDPVPVANTTARTALVAALTADSQTPSPSNPLTVFRADARPDSALEVTTDGSTWQAIPLMTQNDSWTPAVVSGLTVGNGIWTGRYTVIGNRCLASFSFQLGSSSSVGVTLLAFPVPISTDYALNHNCGSASVLDSNVGSTTRTGASLYVSSTATPGAFFLGGTGGQMNATTPFTWAVGDIFSGSLNYEIA